MTIVCIGQCVQENCPFWDIEKQDCQEDAGVTQVAGGEEAEDREDIREGLKALADEKGTVTWEEYQIRRKVRAMDRKFLQSVIRYHEAGLAGYRAQMSPSVQVLEELTVDYLKSLMEENYGEEVSQG